MAWGLHPRLGARCLVPAAGSWGEAEQLSALEPAVPCRRRGAGAHRCQPRQRARRAMARRAHGCRQWAPGATVPSTLLLAGTEAAGEQGSLYGARQRVQLRGPVARAACTQPGASLMGGCRRAEGSSQEPSPHTDFGELRGTARSYLPQAAPTGPAPSYRLEGARGAAELPPHQLGGSS